MTQPGAEERYRRLSLLGRGGMGEVFLADDRLLRRKVAIKVVHKNALSNPRAEKLLRREAKAAAALDNPFICKVYEVGEEDGRVFIAMEYIQGETLRQRMTRGIVPVREALNIAREIADGLEEAGKQKVIHRDLKPSNIILTSQGHVKIMDFGLAKRTPTEESIAESSGTPEGMVVGTREYMSPEQLRGKPLEPSSDLFALGLVLYEMLAGAHPFRKAAAIDTQFAILNDDCRDLADLCPDASDELCDLIDDLLEKSPGDRPSIAALRERLARLSDSARFELKERTEGSARSASASVEQFVARKPRVALGVGLGLLLAVVGLSLWLGLRPDPTPPQARMSTLVTWPSNEDHASLSPDGKSVTFISNRNGVKDIWLMDLAGGEPRKITNAPGELASQVFSEDGAEVAYTLESPTQKLFQTIRLDGGPPTRSFSLPNDVRVFRLIRWVGNNVFLETQSHQLLALSVKSGELAPLKTPPREKRFPEAFDVSSDGKRIAVGALVEEGSRLIWLQGIDGEPSAVTSPGAMDQSPFFADPSGQSFFFESNRSGQEDLWFMGRRSREPRQITFGSNREFMEAVSQDGRIVIFSEVQEGGSIFSYEMATGNRRQLSAENTRDITPSVSKDGRMVFARTRAAATTPTEQSSIVLSSLTDAGAGEARVVFREGFSPLLSPDGRHLAFMTQAQSAALPHLNLLDVESGHVRDLGERFLRAIAYMDFAWSFTRRDFTWSNQGHLYFMGTADGKAARVMKVKPGNEPEVVATLPPGDEVKDLTISPDGARVLYTRIKRGEPSVITEVIGNRLSPLFSTTQMSTSLLGLVQGTPLITQRAGLNEPVVVSELVNGRLREKVRFKAVSESWRLVASGRAVAFSRRDSGDVENIFLVDLQSGKESPVTSNGIQGVAFSPVSDSGKGVLVYSQQLRNKDVGIIRLESR
jgi:serine/threonine protein kinase